MMLTNRKAVEKGLTTPSQFCIIVIEKSKAGESIATFYG